jgi:hypothetical protein
MSHFNYELRFHTLFSTVTQYGKGRAVAQVVIRWLPTAVVLVRSLGFVVVKVALAQVLSEHFNFLCQFAFH